MGKWTEYVTQNHATIKRRAVTTARYEKFQDLCYTFTAFSISQKCEKLFGYLKSFANIDKYEIIVDSEESE